MLSPMFNSQKLFLLEELLPLKKRGRDRSSSFTSDLPKAFEIGESSRKIEGLRKGRVIIQLDFDNLEAELRESRTQIAKLQRNQMGNNNKIALDRFRIANLEQNIEDIQYKGKLMPPKRTSTSEAPTMTQVAIRKLVADNVTAALEAQAATMANADNTNRNTGEREAPVARKCSYK
ncbi:hypothetical protein Tco_0273277 [Tanacetum coccineum]